MNKKICLRCKKEKGIEQFRLRSDTGKRRGTCIACDDAKVEAWNEAHPQGRKDISKRYMRKRRAIDAAFREADRISCRERNRARARRVRRDVLVAYGGRCACCGETHEEFLGVDHIDGGGNQHRIAIRRWGSSFYLWLKNQGFPKQYRLLCDNCNMSRARYGYCPHDKEREAGKGEPASLPLPVMSHTISQRANLELGTLVAVREGRASLLPAKPLRRALRISAP